MSRLIIGSLLLLTMLFSPLAQARNDYSPRSDVKASLPNHPLIGDVKQRLLPAPPTLEHYGAYFYDLQEESGAHATIFLYSGMGLPKAAVEINRDVARGDTLYTITTLPAGRAWVKVGSQKTAPGLLYTMNTSSGRTMKVEVALAPAKSRGMRAAAARVRKAFKPLVCTARIDGRRSPSHRQTMHRLGA